MLKKKRMIARYLKQQQNNRGDCNHQVHHLNPQSITAPSVFITSFEDTVAQKRPGNSQPCCTNGSVSPERKTGFTAQSSSQQAPASSILFPEGNPYPNLLSFISYSSHLHAPADQNLLQMSYHYLLRIKLHIL